MTLTIPLWIALIPLAIIVWIVVGFIMHAIVFYTSPYRSGKENGIGRGEDSIQMFANILFWPLIAVSLPHYFRTLNRNRKETNR